MTLYQIFKRFLKDNDLYGVLFYGNKEKTIKYFKLRYRGENIFNKNTYYAPVLDIIPNAISAHPIFRGPSTSANRKHYYSICQKWRRMIKNHIFLQTNISVGDILYDANGNKCKVVKVGYNNPLIREFRIAVTYGGGSFRYFRNVSYFKSAENKDLVVNFYYKDYKGKCYGKIDGNYNEI